MRFFSKRMSLAMALLLLNACAETPSDKFQLSPVSFSALPGWTSDHVSEALPAMAKSCSVLGKHAAGWQEICASLMTVQPNDNATREFLQQWFQPYAVNGGKDGLFTGYYEAELHGASQRGGVYQTPLYAMPKDLVTVDLGLFKSDLKGQRIVGKVDGNKLKPYDARAVIEAGSLNNRAQILMWVDDPVDAFFLAVQGSGRVHVTDGSTVRVGFDGTNGQAYVAIGRALADKNEIQKPVTMQSIRNWLKAHPDRADEIMNLNPSYVFFRIIDGDGPVGAEGVALTPQRSFAVDPAFVKLGTPVWLDTQDGSGNVLQRLVIAQDTGGAIKGAVRGDYFWGFGDDAAKRAGNMQSNGRYYILLPKSAAPN